MPLDAQGNPRSGFGRMAHANAAHAEKTAGAKPMKAPAEGGEGGGEAKGNDVSGMDIKAVVAKHGPATAMSSTHDHAGGKHHVHTTHGEKHHHSQHGSKEEAHEHMGHAMGMDSEQNDDNAEASPDQEGESEMASMGTSGGSIPGLK